MLPPVKYTVVLASQDPLIVRSPGAVNGLVAGEVTVGADGATVSLIQLIESAPDVVPAFGLN